MTIDPFRLTIALVPLAAYLLLLALVNLRRRPLITAGGNDLAALGAALTGLAFVGPIELFRPEAAATEFGNYVWIFLVAFYWLWVSLFVLLARPRLVIYNITAEQLHPVLAEAAAGLDAESRWAGDNLVLPSLGVQLHLDSSPIMRNVSLVSSGSRQNLEGWRRLASALTKKLEPVRVPANPCTVGLFLTSVLLLATCVMHMLSHPQELAQAMREVFWY